MSIQGKDCHNDLYKINGSMDEKLIRVERSWHKRAQVKLHTQKPDDLIDLNTPDFLEELLPFFNDVNYQQYPKPLKMLLLSAGWVMYNQKTIAIETEVICPACISLLRDHPLSYATAAAISETLTDEAFHTLFSVNMCEMAISQRGINISWPQLELSRHLAHKQTLMQESNFKIYQLAFALISETFISDYLSSLSEASQIQPVFRHAVALHKKDEAVHKNIFPMFIRDIFKELPKQHKEIFLQGVTAAIRLFPMHEVYAWKEIFPQIFKIYGDTSLPLPTLFSQTSPVDYSTVLEVLGSIDIHVSDYLMDEIIEIGTLRVC
jgi:AraC-like DNA-binding protein